MNDFVETMPSGALHFDGSFAHFPTSPTRSHTLGRAKNLRLRHTSLIHAFAAAAKASATMGITLVPEGDGADVPCSYRQLYHESMRVARSLHKKGVRRGDRVLIVLPTSFEFVQSFFGVLLVGAIPVPSYPPSGLRIDAAIARLSHIAVKSAARLCITNQAIYPYIGELGLRAKTLKKIALVEDLQRRVADSFKPRAQGEDPALIQYTSGSTDFPKGVLLSHKNLMANMQAIGLATHVTRSDVTVSWLPMYHDMGLIGTLLFSIYWQIPLVLMAPTTFLLRPSRWLWAIHRHRGTLSPAPNFAYALCVRRIKPAERQGLDLSSWRFAGNGAEPVDYRTITSFLDTYQPHGFRPETMLPMYGLAEASLAVTFPRLGDPVRYQVIDREKLARGEIKAAEGKNAIAVVSVGAPVPGHEVRMVDENGRPVAERTVGHILVRGPSIMEGYFENPEATSAVFQDGWLRTGDLGFRLDGEIYITGRAKDMIIVRGRNVFAADLERVAERVAGVRPGGAVAFGVYNDEQATEEITLVAETTLTEKNAHTALIRSVKEFVLDRSGVRIDRVVLVPPRTLPRTSSGKKQRSQTRHLFLEGELDLPSLGRMKLGMVYMRSRAGHLVVAARRWIGGGSAS